MQRLLVANRGEIAVRILRTARELGIETVAIHAPEDAALASHYPADALVALPARGASAYLDHEAIVEIAQQQGCEAIHPGYGFASERAEFARCCEDAGIVFVGPSAQVLELFGDKSSARAFATERGVAVVPGLAAPVTATEIRAFLETRPAAGAILLKAVAGGGGRGIRRIARGDPLEEAMARCRSEAARSFGSDELFAEWAIDNARHIEIQVVADTEGTTRSLGERDCTLQRRHQKLIEIAPSPGLSPELRTRLSDQAVRLAQAAGYCGVGTFEFLVEPDDQAYFIEANPRLQVEHTITEEVTGLDLVALQLGIAAGRSLADLGVETPPTPRGYAIQLRVLAEEVDETGLTRPSTEPVTLFEPPSGPGIRIDSAFRAGLAPHPAFDSLVAKLIVSTRDDDYPRALRRARRAVADFRIRGPGTNLDFLAALLARPEFERNAFTTTFVETHAAALHQATSAIGRVSTNAPNDDDPDRSAAGSDAADSDVTTDRDPLLARGLSAIRAPLTGTILEVGVERGDSVRAGQTICVLESMKMEHLVTSPANGLIAELFARPGQVTNEGELIAGLSAGEHVEQAEASAENRPLDEIRPDLAAVRARHALLENAARPEAVARRRGRGQRTARENLADLCDPGSFSEYGALAVAAMRKARPLDDLQRKTPGDAIITGMATVNADLVGSENARCAVLVVDATVLAGTQGFFHHQKIDRILELAEQAGTPVVFFPEGGGGRPNDTDASDIFVAGLNITSFRSFARLSGQVPRISVVSGFCFAGSAAFAGCADLIIATRHSSLGMGGPAMIEGGGLGRFDPQEIGPSAVQEANGVIDLLVDDEADAVEATRRLLAYFQGATPEWTCADPRVLRHAVPENRRRVYDVRRVIEGLCDTDSVFELRRHYARGMITALVRLEGRPLGLIANDPEHLGGAIDEVGAEKAARFLQLCDAFGLPIVSLCDTPGFMVGPEIERRAQVRKVSRLFVVGASLTVPVFCVILRKGYGLGAQAMAGGSFDAPFDIVAWPTGEIGGMGLEGAVRLGFKKELEALDDEAERNALFEKLVGALYEKGQALNAASQLEFDAVIDPAETRARLLRGLRAFGPVARGRHSFVDTW